MKENLLMMNMMEMMDVFIMKVEIFILDNLRKGKKMEVDAFMIKIII